MTGANLKGALTVLALLMFLLLAFWGVNMYRHYDSGKWTKTQKITDIIGLLLLLAVFGSMVIPILRK